MNTHDHKTMTTHDLLEAASLDAMGLLDADEREQFELAFRAAHPSVQAQIRREQLRLSTMDSMLPTIDAPLGLRARVLGAVRDAMQNVSGKRVAASGAIAPPLRQSSGVSRGWRIGAFAAMAASLVFGFTTLQVMSEYRALSEVQGNEAVARRLMSEFGARFEQSLVDNKTQFVKFTPMGEPGDTRGKALIMFDPTNRRAQLIVKDLPAMDSDYEVVVMDEHGNAAQAILTFKAPEAGFRTATINNVDVGSAKQLLIRLQGSGKPVLSSTGGL